jgi:oxygen-independent coproporphyrinogen-3 oxidase
MTWRVVAEARRLGVPSINVDLIYGLPHQTRQGFAATVEEVLTLAPDRLAVFNFAYLPAMFRHQRAIDAAALPGPAEKLAILEGTVAALTAAGYVFLGMDHFARPGDSLAAALREGTMTRNFQGYSTHAETDLVAFGVSSIGKVAGGYAQNARSVPELQAALDAGRFATCRGLVLSAEDRLRREAIMSLMCRFRLDKGPLSERFGVDFDRHFAAELAALVPLAEDGLVELGADHLAVTGRGRFLVRNVAMAFDAYLTGESAARYSRTV